MSTFNKVILVIGYLAIIAFLLIATLVVYIDYTCSNARCFG